MKDATEEPTPASERPARPARPSAEHGRGTAKPKRASRRAVRVWAWTAGILSFLSPWALLGLWPKPAASSAAEIPATTTASTKPQRPVVVVVTKRIVISKSASSSVSTSGSGPINYVYAPSSSSSVATSCGTPPC